MPGSFTVCDYQRVRCSTMASVPVQRYSPLQKLWLASKDRLLDIMQLGLNQIGAGSLAFTLGSLRPGGTTMLFIEGVDLPRIKYAGRWASEPSLMCYLQESMSYLVWTQLEAQTEALLLQQVSDTHFAWILPPTCGSLQIFGAWRALRQRRRHKH